MLKLCKTTRTNRNYVAESGTERKHEANSQLRQNDNKCIQYEKAFLDESHLGLGCANFYDVI
jgi:hypothetical protein